MSGMTGRKGRVGGAVRGVGKAAAQPAQGLQTATLEGRRGARNSRWSGEMRRDREEHPWRRRRTGLALTLRRDSVGSERD